MINQAICLYFWVKNGPKQSEMKPPASPNVISVVFRWVCLTSLDLVNVFVDELDYASITPEGQVSSGLIAFLVWLWYCCNALLKLRPFCDLQVQVKRQALVKRFATLRGCVYNDAKALRHLAPLRRFSAVLKQEKRCARWKEPLSDLFSAPH